MTWPPSPAPTADAVTAEPEPVRQAKNGALNVITLDRPAARNALDGRSIAILSAALPRIARDADTYAVVLRSSRAGVFCAGGDVRALTNLQQRDPSAARATLAAEYRCVWLFECFSKPVVSLLDGTVMGGGAGLTLVNTHRVAGEAYGFAMPEVHLGFFPDDGVAQVLARLPGGIGPYLALTGRRIGRADAFALGLVTHCIDAALFAEIEQRLADADPVDRLLDRLHVAPGDGDLVAARAHIDHCFMATSVEEITHRLTLLRDGGGEGGAWAGPVLSELRTASPLALKVALRHVRQARALDLRQTLIVDYRLGARLLAIGEFTEGVRAAMIDKDRKPRWRPDTPADVSEAMIEDLFRPSPQATFELPTRQEMQAARV